MKFMNLWITKKKASGYSNVPLRNELVKKSSRNSKFN